MDAESNPNYRADPAPEWPGLHVSIFDGSLLPVAMATGATHVVYYVNPAFCRMMGKSKDELIGNSFADIMPKDGCLQSLDRVYKTGEAETHTEPEQPEAHSLYWSYTIWPFPGAGERPAGVVFKVTETARFHQQATAMNQELMLAVVRQHELTAQLQQEIAERKRMEQALVNSEKLAVTARFAATMAHEIMSDYQSYVSAGPAPNHSRGASLRGYGGRSAKSARSHNHTDAQVSPRQQPANRIQVEFSAPRRIGLLSSSHKETRSRCQSAH